MRATLLCISLLLCATGAFAVELLMRVNDKAVYHTNAAEAAAGQIVAGMFVTMKPDGWQWGSMECQPNWIIVKLPNVTNTALLSKYLQHETDGTNITRYREWKFKTTNMTTLQRRILTNSSITIRASGGDFTWTRFRTNLWNLRSNVVETADLE